jgi:ribosomal protein S18 acetylase RimI-like enzyme
MPSNYTLRRPTSADAPAISSLIGTTWSHFFAYSIPSDDLAGYLAGPISPSSIQRDIHNSSEHFIVATPLGHSNVIVGVVQLASGILEPSLTMPKPIHLRRLYVDKAHHGTGLARELMNATEGLAQGLGYESIWLGVWEDNTQGQRFYEKMGYAKCGNKFFVMGKSHRKDYVLEKRLQ